MAVLGDEVARRLNYPTDNISYSAERYTFQLNGETRVAAGLAYLDTGKIVIYPNQINRSEDVRNVMAHEIGHQVFQTVQNRQSTERDRVLGEPDVLVQDQDKDSLNPPRRQPAMRADGSLREGVGLEEKYPAYALTNKFDVASLKQLEKEDGVTQYSRDWWQAFSAGTATRSQAMHETFAEISSLDYTHRGNPSTKLVNSSLKFFGVKPTWIKFYNAHQRAYKAIKAKQT